MTAKATVLRVLRTVQEVLGGAADPLICAIQTEVGKEDETLRGTMIHYAATVPIWITPLLLAGEKTLHHC